MIKILHCNQNSHSINQLTFDRQVLNTEHRTPITNHPHARYRLPTKSCLKVSFKLTKTESLKLGDKYSLKPMNSSPAKGNMLTINSIVIEDLTLSVMNLEHVTSAYKQLGITDIFLGVLGTDVLEPHKVVIDYADMKLWLK